MKKILKKTVYATEDGCYVPAQKNKRDVNGKKGSKETEYVPNAVSTVQFGLRTKQDEEQDASVKDIAYIAGATYYEVFGIVISLGLLSNKVVFFFDGELRIVEFFLIFLVERKLFNHNYGLVSLGSNCRPIHFYYLKK